MNELTATDNRSAIIEQVLLKGDLAKLSADERTHYYMETCRSLGLNPLTKPFDFITLNGRLVMYAKRDAADQLRKLNGVNIEIVDQRFEGDLYLVQVRATDKSGRQDEDLGVVAMPKGGAPEIRANVILKAITKAKRRVTLSICGLGFLDESDVEDIAKQEKTSRRRKGGLVTSAAPALDAPLEQAPLVEQEKPPFEGEGAELLNEMDAALAKAAQQGVQALQDEWATIHPRWQKPLKQRLDTVHKPAAQAASKS